MCASCEQLIAKAAAGEAFDQESLELMVDGLLEAVTELHEHVTENLEPVDWVDMLTDTIGRLEQVGRVCLSNSYVLAVLRQTEIRKRAASN